MSAETDAAAAAATAAAAAAAAAAKPWYEGKAEAEHIGHWQNKGWDAKDPGLVAIEATKAHLNAEKLLGVPSTQLLRLPVDPSKDPDAMKVVWSRLGAPAKAEEYELPAFKGADGKVLDPNLDTALRETMLKVGVPKSMATDIAATIAKVTTDAKLANEANVAAALKDQAEMLKKNWGTNFDTNKVVATNAAKALGFTPAEIDDLEKLTSYAGIMEKLRLVGTKIGEASFLQPNGPGGMNIASRQQAVARLEELKRDTGWTKKLMDGDVAVRREFDDLSKLSSSED